MDRTDIFRIALNLFNMDYDSVTDGIEAIYCENFLESAESVCAAIRDWPWLIRSKQFTEEERLESSYHGLDYGYKVPDDMSYPYLVNGKHDDSIRWAGDCIYFSTENPRLDYITKEVEYEKMPTPYMMLIASELAREIAPMIAPDSAVEKRATSLFQSQLATLIQMNIKGKRDKTPHKDFFVV